MFAFDSSLRSNRSMFFWWVIITIIGMRMENIISGLVSTGISVAVAKCALKVLLMMMIIIGNNTDAVMDASDT